MTAEVLPGDDPDVARMLSAHAVRAFEEISEAEVRERMRVLAENLVAATVHQDHLPFHSSVAATCRFLRTVLVAKIGKECDTVDLYACLFIEEAGKCRAQALGLPDPPEGLWERWKAMLAATAEVAPDE